MKSHMFYGTDRDGFVVSVSTSDAGHTKNHYRIVQTASLLGTQALG